MFGFNGEFNARFGLNRRKHKPIERIFNEVMVARERRFKEKTLENASRTLVQSIRMKVTVAKQKENSYEEFVMLWIETPRRENLSRLILLFCHFYEETKHQNIFSLVHGEILRNQSSIVSLLSSPVPLGANIICIEVSGYLSSLKEEHLTIAIFLLKAYLKLEDSSSFIECLELGLFGIIGAILVKDVGSFIVPRVGRVMEMFISMVCPQTFVSFFVKEIFSTQSRDLDRLICRLPLSDMFNLFHPTCSDLFRETSSINIILNYNSLTRLLFDHNHCNRISLLSFSYALLDLLTQFHDNSKPHICRDSWNRAIYLFTATVNDFNSFFAPDDVTVISDLFFLIDMVNVPTKLDFPLLEHPSFLFALLSGALSQFNFFSDHDCYHRIYCPQFSREDAQTYFRREKFSVIYTSCCLLFNYLNRVFLEGGIPTEIEGIIFQWGRAAFKFYVVFGLSLYSEDNLNPAIFQALKKLPNIVRRVYLWSVRRGRNMEWVFPDISFTRVPIADHLSTESLKYISRTCNREFPLHFLASAVKIVPQLYPFSARAQLIPDDTPRPSGHVSLSRHNLYHEAFLLFARDSSYFTRSIPTISFINPAGAAEPGVDGGGLFREFLITLVEEAFGPDSHFFVECNVSGRSLFPNPMASFRFSYLNYSFIGMMVARAIAMGITIPKVNISPVFWLQVLDPLFSLDAHWLDLIDCDLYRNLLTLRTIPNVEELDINFTVDVPTEDGVATRLLKEEGDQISVTRHNVEEYIRLYADFKLTKSVQHQITSFREGMVTVISSLFLGMFDAEEMQRLLAGDSHTFDFQDFRENVVYDGYRENSNVIQNFWIVFNSFTSQEAFNLLKFATSYTAAPRGGFKNLHPKFCITLHSYSQDNHLPTASTCSNNFCLPPYSSLEIMTQRLKFIVHNPIGFELN